MVPGPVVYIKSVPIPSDNIFCSSTSPVMNDYERYWSSQIIYAPFLSVTSSFVRYFVPQNGNTLDGFVISSSGTGARNTVRGDDILCISFSSTLTYPALPI